MPLSDRREPLSRREMLLVSAAGVLSLVDGSASMQCDIPTRGGAPAVDYHAHIGEGISVGDAIAIAKRRGMKFGLQQHAGVEGHGYAVTNDDELNTWVQSLEGKPVFKAIEAEGTDWRPSFTRAALAKLDYVQGDPLGVPDKSGVPMRIWEPQFRVDDPQAFMDRYVDYHVQRISAEPLDILVVPTLLPLVLSADYERLWTEERRRAVIDAAVTHGVALEIDCRFRVPSLSFLQAARAAGVKFAFGSNYQ